MTIVSSDSIKKLVAGYEADILVSDMDSRNNNLITPGGHTFYEVNSNVWKERGSDVAYLGTGRHGGGITLRLLFVKYHDGWINVNTGRPAPFKAEEFDV